MGIYISGKDSVYIEMAHFIWDLIYVDKLKEI